LNAVVSPAGVGDGGQKHVSLTLLTVTGAVGTKGGPNLTYVATNLTFGSGVEDNTSTLSLEISSSSMGGTSAVAGTRGILLRTLAYQPVRLAVHQHYKLSPYHKEASQAYRACDQKLCIFGLHLQTRRSQNYSCPAHAAW
jgi:hypothetical protein